MNSQNKKKIKFEEMVLYLNCDLQGKIINL